MKSRLFRYAIYASILLGAGCASHQEVIRADSRISNIEKSKDQFQLRMEDFRKNQMEKDQQLRSQYAELYATVDRLQEQIQILSGKIEEKEHPHYGYYQRIVHIRVAFPVRLLSVRLRYEIHLENWIRFCHKDLRIAI